jgi:hypothetical protein
MGAKRPKPIESPRAVYNTFWAAASWGVASSVTRNSEQMLKEINLIVKISGLVILLRTWCALENRRMGLPPLIVLKVNYYKVN